MSRDFDCVECGRHIISFGYDMKIDLCAACITLPGWYMNPELVKILDPENRRNPKNVGSGAN